MFENFSNMSGNTSQSKQILWINQISTDDYRKGAYKADKNKPCKSISLAFSNQRFKQNENLSSVEYSDKRPLKLQNLNF